MARKTIETTKRTYCRDGSMDKEKAVYDRYCELMKAGNKALHDVGVKSPISITPIYEQVADEFFYSSYRSIQRIIREQLKKQS